MQDTRTLHPGCMVWLRSRDTGGGGVPQQVHCESGEWFRVQLSVVITPCTQAYMTWLRSRNTGVWGGSGHHSVRFPEVRQGLHLVGFVLCSIQHPAF